MTKEQFEDLLTLVRMTHHGLKDVNDPAFVKDEITYKRKAAEKAAELLSSAELQRLIDSEDLAELKSRVLKVGATNLLWNSVPMQGDLALFHSELLDLDVFKKLRELLYGEEASEERLQRWSSYLDSRGLNNKWTTPTYFLFLLFPQTEYFVKPSAASWLLKQAGLPTPLEARPSGGVYRAIRQVASEALVQSQELGARDMIDVQSLLWVAHSSSQRLQKQFADAKEAGTIHFSERARKLGYPAVAGRIIRHTIDQGPLSNEKLTAFIQLFRHGAKREETVRKNLAVCGAEGYAEELLAISLEGGYTAAGRLAIEGLDSERLEVVRKLLLSVAGASTFDEVATAIEAFESEDVPLVKHGIYSPWLHYLQPTICPLLNNAVIDSFRSIGFPRTGSYVEAMRIARAASRQIGIADLGDLDTMFFAEGQPGTQEVPAEGSVSEYSQELIALMRHALDTIGVVSPDDQRVALNRTNKGRKLSLTFGDWLLLAIPSSEFPKVPLTINLDTRIYSPEEFRKSVRKSFSFTKDGPSFGLFHIPLDVFQVDTDKLMPAFDSALQRAKEIFGDWAKTPHRKPDSLQLLRRLFDDGFAVLAGTKARSEHAAPAFASRTFELLQAIDATPTKEFYLNQKDDFVSFVELPFKSVFRMAIQRLPEEIRAFMETESNLFSRFPKNDYGRGGAYPWFWGAIYPRGTQRIRGIQLYATINKEEARIGFDASMDAEAAQRLLSAIGSNRTRLIEELSESLGSDEWKFGKQTSGKSPRSDEYPWFTEDLTSWLDNLPDSKARVLKVVSKEELLHLSVEELSELICQTFIALFPLVQLASGIEPFSSSFISGQSEFESDLKVLEEYSSYTAEVETGFSREEFEQWANALRRKRQAILYGPPGTGKTFMARKLADHIVGGTTGRIDLIQFHPTYTYEDFMQGLRPETRTDGQLAFRWQPGRFLDFCSKAEQRNGAPCILIIDEINRANLSKVFGELMYLLEYRDKSIPLASGKEFRIPENVLIIGTMNTADRSIALVDFALRRRFAFIRMQPRLELLRSRLPQMSPGFPVDKLIAILTELNQAIGEDGFKIGITYFLDPNLENNIESVWLNEIEPYLEEFFFERPELTDQYRWTSVSGRLKG